jgi:HPt (histidine-containing phosphotransfer) domain-containing protein
MAAAQTLATSIHSDLAHDPELRGLVEMFAQEMPQRAQNLESLRAANDWDAVGRAAHQLKGAAGSYGFHELAPYAARLEAAIRRDHFDDRVPILLDELLDACGRVRTH